MEFIAFDIETDSAVEATARTIGIGVSYYTDEGFYFPFASFDREKNELVSLVDEKTERDFVAALCEILLRKKLIMHNGVFDVTVIMQQYGIDLTKALYADTILMKHTLEEERPFKLKEIAEIFKLDIGFTEEEAANQEQMELKESVIAAGGKWTQEQKDIYKGKMEIIGKYCCADTDLTLKLFEYFQQRLYDEQLEEFFYEEEVMPLYREVTIPMKMGGVFVDVEYFQQLEKELNSDIIRLTNSVFDMIREDARPLVEEILDEKVKETRTGRFAEGVLQYYNIPVPLNKKTGKPTLARSALTQLLDSYPDHPAIKWLLYTPPSTVTIHEEEVEVTEETENGPVTTTKIRKRREVVLGPIPDDAPKLNKKDIYKIKKNIFVASKPELPEVFNLSSNKHLSWLLFKKYKVDPVGYSRTSGEAKVDKDSIASYDHLPFIKELLELRKTEKLLSTYVEPILSQHLDGWLYPSMFQFGTTSGRYSCGGGLNLQTLPRDDKRIKKGFIAPPGYKIVNADFSSLEPRIFSWVSGDPGLKEVWRHGLDLYSQIAIDTFGLEGVSARESDATYLKKVMPEWRQKSKTFTLAVPYGANAWRIAEQMKIEPEEAKEIINNYLDAYPMLKEYMTGQEIAARSKGYVRSHFGRIRHLPECKRLYKVMRNTLYNKRAMQKLYGEEDGSRMYYEFRNCLNNAKNFPIQATAAHVCNAALIKMARLMKKERIDGWICLQVHDEITCIVKEKHAERAAELLKESMEKNSITKQIDIPILAEPVISTNFADAK